MKASVSRSLRHRLRRRKGDTRELAAQLAPLEEQGPAGAQGVSIPRGSTELVTQERGAIVVGNQKPRLPEDLVKGDAPGEFLGVEPIIMVIVGLMLVFIIFIAWQVSRM